MKKSLFLFLALSLCLSVLSGCSSSEESTGPAFPIDAEKAVIISEPDNLMTHVPTTHITKDGEMLVAYYRDLHNNIEHPKFNTIELMLSRFDINKWENPEVKHKSLLKVGGKIGSFTQGYEYPPYDPSFFYSGDTLRCVFMAHDGENIVHMCFDIDIESGNPVGEVKPCTLTYTRDGKTNTIILTTTNYKEYYSSALGITNMKSFRNPIFCKKFHKIGEWYYTALGNWCCQGSIPVIARTKNGIDYEEVFYCPEYIYGAAEIELAVKNDRLFVIVRSAEPELKSAAGIYLGVYSLDGKCLREPYKVGDNESRPDMMVYKNKVYAMFNVMPNNIDDTTGKEIFRSRVRLAEIDDNGKIVRAWEYAAPYSMQYYQLDVYNNKPYLTFIADRFDRAFDRKGHLTFLQLDM